MFYTQTESEYKPNQGLSTAHELAEWIKEFLMKGKNVNKHCQYLASLFPVSFVHACLVQGLWDFTEDADDDRADPDSDWI